MGFDLRPLLVLLALISPDGAVRAEDGRAADLLERAYRLDAGDGLARDAAAAAALYRQAASQGDAHAQLRLGHLHELGQGVEQSYELARRYFEAAVAGGLSDARMRLAFCHLEGWGGPADRSAFAGEMKRAAEAGYVPAMQVYAAACLIGLGRPVDKDAAIGWLARAAATDSAEAQYQLGSLTEKRRRLNREADQGIARGWYQLSAEQDYAVAMRAMARTFLLGNPSGEDWQFARRWLDLASEGGDPEAPLTLAIFAIQGAFVPASDRVQADGWLRQAAERGNIRAQEVLALREVGFTAREAIDHILSVSFEDRYVQRAARARSGEQEALNAEPLPLHLVRPIYPASLWLAGVEGSAMIAFVVDSAGRVRDPRAESASHPLFGARAAEAVARWQFKPGVRDGRRVHTRLRVPVIFRVSSETVDGVDGLLGVVRSAAAAIGPEAEADARDARPAVPVGGGFSLAWADGTPLPADARALVLLALDATGRPLRCHVLRCEPANLRERVADIAMTARFTPRSIAGEPAPSSVVVLLPPPRRPSPAVTPAAP
jgi:TonB family protein